MNRKSFLTGLAAAGLVIGAAGAAPVVAQQPRAVAQDASPAATPVPAVPTVPTGYAELDQALTPGADGKLPFAGKSVNIEVQWKTGELAGFEAAMADIQTATGISISVDSTPVSHEAVLKARIDGNAPPDIAQLAQPTPVLAFAAEGKVIDVATFMDADKLSKEHPSTIGLITQGNHIWGVPYKTDVKSMIWYPAKAFAAKGYQVPKTWDDLIKLSDQIVADGSNPWCISAGGPGTATGWQLTDWVEEVVLKTKGLQYYNDWINHKVTFEDPGIKDALDNYVGKIFFTPNYVYGGAQSIVPQDQTTTMDPMFNQDTAAPNCWMQKIPGWYGPTEFPDQRATGQPSKYTIGQGQDIDVMPFPSIDPSQNNIEGSADTMMMLVDRPEVRAIEEFLAVPTGIQNWIRLGTAISANNTTPTDWYTSYVSGQQAGYIANAQGIGFDASDLMPGPVGAGTFWSQMDDWVNSNGSNTDAVLQAIDQSWPSQ